MAPPSPSPAPTSPPTRPPSASSSNPPTSSPDASLAVSDPAADLGLFLRVIQGESWEFTWEEVRGLAGMGRRYESWCALALVKAEAL